MSNLVASQQAYRRGERLAASPGQTIVLLYDGARRFLRQATMAMRAGEVERAHKAMRRGEMIIGHLDGNLDYEQGAIADRLHAIYTFCMRHLNEARMGQDATKVEQIVDLLGELREAWAQAAGEVDRG